MRGLRALCAVAFSAVLAGPAVGAPAGGPTTVMVLGSTHLSGMPKTVQPAFLATLLDRLASSKPDIIVVEGLSGEQCDHLRRYEPVYPGVYENYCLSPEVAAKSTGLDVPAATMAVQKTLAAWPATPTSAQRRTLAAQFAAAGERASALVQWLRLPVAERREGDGIDAALLEAMHVAMGRFNENYAIGAVLAARLGHERVFAVDDHTSDSIQAAAGPEHEAAIQKIWNSPRAAREKSALDAREAAIRSSADLLGYYRWMNSAATMKAFADVDQTAAGKDSTPPFHGRQYVAWWETRNLRMVAHIRAAAGNRPGTRVLAIVGASHKAPYERYLGVMSDVRVLPVNALLKP